MNAQFIAQTETPDQVASMCISGDGNVLLTGGAQQSVGTVTIRRLNK